MAQSSKGIKLYWNEGTIGVDQSGNPTFTPKTGSGSTPQAWAEIRDITSIPALQGDPNMLDTTVLAETKQKTYIKGLDDNGGSMTYGALLTPNLISDAAAAVTAHKALTGSNVIVFKIEFPAPLNCYYWYKGEPTEVMPREAEVDAVLATNFVTSIETAPVKVANV